MIQVNRIYLIFNRLVTKKFLVDTSGLISKIHCVLQLIPKNSDANVWRNKKRMSRNCYEEYMISLIKASKMLLKKV